MQQQCLFWKMMRERIALALQSAFAHFTSNCNLIILSINWNILMQTQCLHGYSSSQMKP